MRVVNQGNVGLPGLEGPVGPVGMKGEEGQRGIGGFPGKMGPKGFRGTEGLPGLGGLPGLDREMLSNAHAQVSKETENYARYLATFQHQLEAGNKAGAAMAELDRARMAAAKVRLNH